MLLLIQVICVCPGDDNSFYSADVSFQKRQNLGEKKLNANAIYSLNQKKKVWTKAHSEMNSSILFFLKFADGEFQPEVDETDDEETIEKEEREGIDEVRLLPPSIHVICLERTFSHNGVHTTRLWCDLWNGHCVSVTSSETRH